MYCGFESRSYFNRVKHKQQFTPEDYQRLLQRSGFCILRAIRAQSELITRTFFTILELNPKFGKRIADLV